MLRSSLFNFGKVFAVQNVRYHLKCFTSVPPLIYQHSSNFRSIHSSAILTQKKKKDVSLKTAAVSSSESISIPTVSITGFNALHGGQPYYGIYWNDFDFMNTLKEHSSPNASLVHAHIESATLALQQAIYERKLKKLLIKTDSIYLVKVVNTYLEKWRTNNYTKTDRTPVKHREEYKKLDKLLSKIDAKFELTPPSSDNHVMEKLKNDQRYVQTVEKLFSGINTFNPKLKQSNAIFVCGVASLEARRRAAYGIHFKSNKKFDVKSRYESFPVSVVRPLMSGIIHALNIVKNEGLKNAVIVTDNEIFLRNFNNGWKRSDGKPVVNSFYYKRIKELADELKVSLCFLSEAHKNRNFKVAVNLAYEGMLMPPAKKSFSSKC
uniref:RNase H type-1 domain-containing protein n=1 Tax=Panagrolaimus sp. ES5 TaxID=591445 RepID=A0AC34GXT5_9BILA